MAEEYEALARAFSGFGGLGVDESCLVSAIGKWRKQPEKRGGFRGSSPFFVAPDAAGGFDRCEDGFLRCAEIEFARFKNLVVQWAMHPWERDARWVHEVFLKAHPFGVIVEIACTRTSDELLGARKAYHALFHRSIEEDVAYRVKESYSNLLVGLVSAYRYEGPRVDDELAKSEAAALGNAIKDAAGRDPAEQPEVIRILTTRSKAHLRATFGHYEEMFGKPIQEEFDSGSCLQETIQCLSSPAYYFSKVIDKSFKGGDENTKDALTRVIVSRSDADIEGIREAYLAQHDAKLEDMIANYTHGNYRDALLSLIGN